MPDEPKAPSLPQYAPPTPPPQPAVHSPGILHRLISRRMKSAPAKAKASPKTSKPKVGGRHSSLQRDQNVHIKHVRIFNHLR
jgi:hypothetical protein